MASENLAWQEMKKAMGKNTGGKMYTGTITSLRPLHVRILANVTITDNVYVSKMVMDEIRYAGEVIKEPMKAGDKVMVQASPDNRMFWILGVIE